MNNEKYCEKQSCGNCVFWMLTHERDEDDGEIYSEGRCKEQNMGNALTMDGDWCDAWRLK